MEAWMQSKTNKHLKKFFELILNNYILLICAIFIIYGLDLLKTKYIYSGDDGRAIITGLKMVAGSILIGASLLSLAIFQKTTRNNVK
jgi:TRAP-type C4-dicarboxylate transport system permease small subunit